MNPRNEAANALAIRCLFTANHMRSFLNSDKEITDDVRQDLTRAVGLLETVSTEIEDSARAA